MTRWEGVPTIPNRCHAAKDWEEDGPKLPQLATGSSLGTAEPLPSCLHVTRLRRSVPKLRPGTQSRCTPPPSGAEGQPGRPQ